MFKLALCLGNRFRTPLTGCIKLLLFRNEVCLFVFFKLNLILKTGPSLLKSPQFVFIRFFCFFKILDLRNDFRLSAKSLSKMRSTSLGPLKLACGLALSYLDPCVPARYGFEARYFHVQVLSDPARICGSPLAGYLFEYLALAFLLPIRKDALRLAQSISRESFLSKTAIVERLSAFVLPASCIDIVVLTEERRTHETNEQNTLLPFQIRKTESQPHRESFPLIYLGSLFLSFDITWFETRCLERQIGARFKKNCFLGKKQIMTSFRKRFLRFSLKSFTLFLILAVLAVFSAFYFLNSLLNSQKERILRNLSHSFQVNLSVEDLDLSWSGLRPQIILKEVLIEKKGQRLRVKNIALDIRLRNPSTPGLAR